MTGMISTQEEHITPLAIFPAKQTSAVWGIRTSLRVPTYFVPVFPRRIPGDYPRERIIIFLQGFSLYQLAMIGQPHSETNCGFARKSFDKIIKGPSINPCWSNQSRYGYYELNLRNFELRHAPPALKKGWANPGGYFPSLYAEAFLTLGKLHSPFSQRCITMYEQMQIGITTKISWCPKTGLDIT